MTKKCVYCSCEISDDSVIDFCEKCGKKVWGEKMFNTIKQNMEDARENGDLCHDNLFTPSGEVIDSRDNFNIR